MGINILLLVVEAEKISRGKRKYFASIEEFTTKIEGQGCRGKSGLGVLFL